MASLGKIHSKDGIACVYFERKRISLGVKWDGKGDIPEDARLLWKAMRDRVNAGLPPKPEKHDSGEYLVGELIADFLDDIEGGHDYMSVRSQLKTLAAVHRLTPVSAFGPVALREMVLALEAEGKKSRQGINRVMQLVRRVWRFGISRERIDPSRLVALQSVEPLRKGRSKAPESVRHGPVDVETLEKTLAVMTGKYASIVKLLRLTGMRPGEACKLAWEDIDRSGERWVIRFKDHKTAYRGILRNVPLSAKAQAVLAWLPGEKTGPCFPGAKTALLALSVIKACKRAKVEPWRPNRIRKLVATEVREKFGIEAARSLLGHRDQEMTLSHYAAQDLARARQAVEGLG